MEYGTSSSHATPPPSNSTPLFAASCFSVSARLQEIFQSADEDPPADDLFAVTHAHGVQGEGDDMEDGDADEFEDADANEDDDDDETQGADEDEDGQSGDRDSRPSGSGSSVPPTTFAFQPPQSPSVTGPLACASMQPTTSGLKRGRNSKQHFKENRRRRRAAAAPIKAKGKYITPNPRQKAKIKHAKMAQPIFTNARLADAKFTSTGYTAKDPKESFTFSNAAENKQQSMPKEKRTYTLQELLGPSFGMRLVDWDGITPMPIVDADGFLLGVLIGKPKGSDFDEKCVHAAEKLRQACEKTTTEVKLSDDIPRRGTFKTLRTGVSHGGGQKRPQNFANTAANQAIIDDLDADPFFENLARFSSSSFAHWAPELSKHYADTIGKLFAHDEKRKQRLKASFVSHFTAATYNLGPQAACFVHLDFANLAYGWCSISALGSFDPKTGGHLVLWECGLVIEFPPGSTILIASALLHHSNVPLSQPHETRYSFTQYTAGAIFRWVDHDFKTTLSHRKSLTKAQLAELDQRNSQRYKFGLSLIPRLQS